MLTNKLSATSPVTFGNTPLAFLVKPVLLRALRTVSQRGKNSEYSRAPKALTACNSLSLFKIRQLNPYVENAVGILEQSLLSQLTSRSVS